MITESMDLLWGQTSTLKTHGLSVEEGGGNGSERVAGGIDLASDPRFAAGVSTAPLLPDAAYMGLVLPMPGVMSAGRLVDDDDALLPGTADDDDGLDGNSRVAICASVH